MHRHVTLTLQKSWCTKPIVFKANEHLFNAACRGKNPALEKKTFGLADDLIIKRFEH